jgi:hypothetical protein
LSAASRLLVWIKRIVVFVVVIVNDRRVLGFKATLHTGKNIYIRVVFLVYLDVADGRWVSDDLRHVVFIVHLVLVNVRLRCVVFECWLNFAPYHHILLYELHLAIAYLFTLKLDLVVTLDHKCPVLFFNCL